VVSFDAIWMTSAARLVHLHDPSGAAELAE
jgi:hypothetical protein